MLSLSFVIPKKDPYRKISLPVRIFFLFFNRLSHPAALARNFLFATAAGFAVARAVDFLRAGGRINRSAVIFFGGFAAIGAFNLVVEFFNVFFKDFTAFAAFVFEKRHNFAPFRPFFSF